MSQNSFDLQRGQNVANQEWLPSCLQRAVHVQKEVVYQPIKARTSLKLCYNTFPKDKGLHRDEVSQSAVAHCALLRIKRQVAVHRRVTLSYKLADTNLKREAQ